MIHVDKIEFRDSSLVKRIGDLLKLSRRGCHQGELVFSSFSDESLCVVRIIRVYLEHTRVIRGSEKSLFIGLQRSHKAVSKDTVTRWVKSALVRAGVYVDVFKPHSVRSASVSAAATSKVPPHTMLRTAGWTRESTFRIYLWLLIQHYVKLSLRGLAC